MDSYCFVIISSAVEGRDAEYNDWYDNQHLADVLAVPGFVSARRFQILDENNSSSQRYLAIYEIESDDPEKTLADLNSRAGTSAMELSEAFDQTSVTAMLCKALVN